MSISFYDTAGAPELEPHEARIMAVLPATNDALLAAIKAGVPGTLTIGPTDPDAEDDGCVRLGLSASESALNVIQRARYEAARDAVGELNRVIRALDEEGWSAMLAIQSKDAPLTLVGFAPRARFLNDAL